MLNNEVRQRLQQLITHYGYSVFDDVKRCEALLKDFCPEHKRELNLLILSLREGVPQQLLKPAPHVGIDFTVKRLTQTLHDNLGIAEHFAFWAVESWALSLQLIQQPIAQTQVEDYQTTIPIIQPSTTNEPEWRDPITGMEFVWIPAGSFMMGSPEDEEDRDRNREEQHHVTIAQGFYLGKYLVTQKQWQAIMGNSPSIFKGADLPVEQVSWFDAQRFALQLSHKSGQTYRLPTESEWEYACRAGTTTPYYTGHTITHQDANFDNYVRKTTPVGSYPSNPWGLYDMVGNVLEWTASAWDNNYKFSEQYADNHDTTSCRVLRGGCWACELEELRSAARLYDPEVFTPDFCADIFGFRLVKI